MIELMDRIFDVMPLGVIVYRETMQIVFRNKTAKLFLKRHDLPDEVPTVVKRMFSSMNKSCFNEDFPGEVYIYKKLEGSHSRWIFKLDVNRTGYPHVIVFVSEESLSDTTDLLEVRRQFKLTRRETDVIRRLLRGLKNADIADEMDIREQTVKDYLSSIYEKAGVRNRLALVRVLMNFRCPDVAKGEIEDTLL